MVLISVGQVEIDTFDDHIRIKNNFTKYLKEMCW